MSNNDLQAVADQQAITGLLYRYCRAVDRLDQELGYSLWHDDGTADYGSDVYQGSGRGFIDFVIESHKQTLGTTHQVTNIIIELEGDRAASEAYHYAVIRVGQGEDFQQITVRGRYLDSWSKRDGRWAIDHRVTVRDLADVRPVTPMSAERSGAFNMSDISYALFEQLRQGDE